MNKNINFSALYGVTLPNKEKGYTDYPVHQA
jgi:hypothetical protein